MQYIFFILCLILPVLACGQSGEPPKMQLSSLCDLQVQSKAGDRRIVQIEGVYLSGMEGASYILVPECSMQSTYVEFNLKTRKNWDLLRSLISEKRDKGKIGDGSPILVVFEGEFFGPPLPNPTWPDWFRKAYHPGWDSNAKTKIIVYSINSASRLSADHPCASKNEDRWPCFQGKNLSR